MAQAAQATKADPPSLEERALRSRLYDGTVIETPWVEGRRWSLASAVSHADEHRREVRISLAERGLRRITRNGEWSPQAQAILEEIFTEQVIRQARALGLRQAV